MQIFFIKFLRGHANIFADKSSWAIKMLGKKKLSIHLNKVLKPILKKNGFANSRIITEWDSIVGAEIAGLCHPLKIVFEGDSKTRGTILISVSNPGAILYLQGMAPVIVEKINGFIGYCAVKNLRTVMQKSSNQIKIPKEKYFFNAQGSKVEECELKEIKNTIENNCEEKELGKVLSAIAKNIFTVK